MRTILTCRTEKLIRMPVVARRSQEVLVARNCATAGRNVILKARERIRDLIIEVFYAAEGMVDIGVQTYLQTVVSRAPHGEEHSILSNIGVNSRESCASAK